MGINNPQQNSILNPATNTMLFDDFYVAQTNAGVTLLQAGVTWDAAVVNGTITTNILGAGQPGIILFTTGGVGAGDRAAIGQFSGGTSDPVVCPIPNTTVMFNLRNAQAAAANLELRAGLQTGLGAGNPNSGIFFRLVGAANWACVTRNGGVETQTPNVLSGATVTSQQFKILVDPLGTTVVFLIGGVIVATHTTNIPAAGQVLGLTFKIDLTALVGPYSFYLDYAYFSQFALNR